MIKAAAITAWNATSEKLPRIATFSGLTGFGLTASSDVIASADKAVASTDSLLLRMNSIVGVSIMVLSFGIKLWWDWRARGRQEAIDEENRRQEEMATMTRRAHACALCKAEKWNLKSCVVQDMHRPVDCPLMQKKP